MHRSGSKFSRTVLIVSAVVMVSGCIFQQKNQVPPPCPPDYGLSFRFEAALCLYQGRQYPYADPPCGYHWYSWSSRAGAGLVNHMLVSDAPSPLVQYVKHICVRGSRLAGHEVIVCFGQNGKPLLGAETAQNITRRLVILKDGAVVMAPVVRREINCCDAIIGHDLSAEEAVWLATALRSVAGTQCPRCPVLFHGEGHSCAHSCGHTYGQGCPYHTCSHSELTHCSHCSRSCTHKAHDYENCPHVLAYTSAAGQLPASSCTGHFACTHSCSSHCHHEGNCAECRAAPPLGKELEKNAPSTNK